METLDGPSAGAEHQRSGNRRPRVADDRWTFYFFVNWLPSVRQTLILRAPAARPRVRTDAPKSQSESDEKHERSILG
jgi:hypothetical protein